MHASRRLCCRALVAYGLLVVPTAGAGAHAEAASRTSILFAAGTYDAYQIWEIGADGRGERLVRELPPSFRGGTWSPTRNAIAFQGDEGKLYVFRISDGRMTAVAPDVAGAPQSFAWSPDGRRLAYIAPGRALRIFTVNANGTGRRRIAASQEPPGPQRRSAIGFSPEKRAALYIVHHGLAWSPDKRNLAYLRRVMYDSRSTASARVHLVSAEGRLKRKLASLRPFVPSTLAWSPDSTKVAVGGYRDSGVMTVSASGNTTRSVTRCCVGVYDLAWSRNGKKLILFSDGSAGPDGAIVNADGTQRRLLRINGHDPAWSRDSKRIAFTGSSGDLYIINADGRGLHWLAEAAGVLAPTWR
jgi:Tol biopolymer transport system component